MLSEIILTMNLALLLEEATKNFANSSLNISVTADLLCHLILFHLSKSNSK